MTDDPHAQDTDDADATKHGTPPDLAVIDGEAHDDDEFDTRSLSEPRRRILTYAALALAVLIPSFFASQLLESHRAIVLDVRENRMFVGYERRPPEWLPERLTDPGNILAKKAWHWNAEPDAVGPEDQALVALYQRYTSRYLGTVTDVRPASQSGTFPYAIVQTDAGQKLSITLVETVLMGVKVNMRVEKRLGRWDPEIIPGEFGNVRDWNLSPGPQTTPAPTPTPVVPTPPAAPAN